MTKLPPVYLSRGSQSIDLDCHVPGRDVCARQSSVVWIASHTATPKGFLMARTVQVQLLDDIDGTEADETLTYGLDGTLYEIDVNTKHAEKLRASLAKYILKSRRVGRGRVTATARTRGGTAPAHTDRAQNLAIRDWAKAKGIEVSDRGRIPASIVEQFQAEAGR